LAIEKIVQFHTFYLGQRWAKLSQDALVIQLQTLHAIVSKKREQGRMGSVRD
jgi:hypothetical protein